MKKIYCLCLLLLCIHALQAQVTLTGKVAGELKGDVELNISRADWFQEVNSVYAKPGKDGAFSFSLPNNSPVFVRLCYNGIACRLLLSPGRNLHVVFDAGDLLSTITFSGKGSTENILIHTYFGTPFFITGTWSKNEYGACTKTTIFETVLPRATDSLDAVKQAIARANIPQPQKDMLLTEVRFRYGLHYDNLRLAMRQQRNADWEPVADSVFTLTGLPTLRETMVSPAAAQYLESYSKYLMSHLERIYVKDKEEGKKQLTSALGMSFDSASTLARLYGDEYLTLIYTHTRMPDALHQRLLADRIIYYSNSREVAPAFAISDLLQRYYPGSRAVFETNVYLTKLNTLRQQGAQNKAIVIRENGAAIGSLAALLEPYKGKVVYLDIWGTWCPPCRDEMNFAPKMKEQFKGKDVVFLYLSNDKDNADKAWRDFIYANNIAGQHVRMGENDRLIWEALLPENERFSYPTFFIFDRDGKLVKKAARPSSGETLYRQLEEVL